MTAETARSPWLRRRSAIHPDTIDTDRYPLSPRVRALKDILVKFSEIGGLDPELARRLHQPAPVGLVVMGLMLSLSACAPDFDFKRDFLCRPDGHCVNASSGHTGIGP